MTNILLCRICLCELDEECVELTASIIEKKTVMELMEDFGEVTVEMLENLPRHVCIPCSETLCTLYNFRKQVQETERNYREKRLTIVKLHDRTMICFAEKDFEIDQLMIVSDTEKQDSDEPASEEIQKKVLDTEINGGNETDKNITVKSENDIEITDESNVIHISEENKKQILESGKVFYTCPDEGCSEIFSSVPLLDRHTSTQHLLHVCEICNDRFAAKINLKKHMLVHSEDKPHICKECGKKFRNIQYLREHKIRLHTTVRPYNCEYCEKGFAFPYELKKHKKFKHGEDTQDKIAENHDEESTNLLKKQSTVRNQKFIYKCPDCNKIFNSITLFGKHKNTQHTPNVCSICNKRFLTKLSLTKHMRSHTGERPFSCNDCQKTFRTGTNLREHKLLMHSSDRPFVCEECGKGFIAAYKLRKHKQKAHSDEKPYVCDICSKAFRASENLYHHRKFHSSKLIACKVCGKMVSNFSMKAHMHIHTGIRYECDICQAKFTIKESMLNHKRTVHEGLKRFECKECGKKFTNSSGVLKHMRSLHMGVRYHCTVCNLIVKTKYCMNKHRRIIHPGQSEESIVNVVKIVEENDEVVDDKANDIE